MENVEKETNTDKPGISLIGTGLGAFRDTL